LGREKSRLLRVKVPAEVEQGILEIVEQEKVDEATVLRILLEMGITEWHKRTALERLKKGRVTFAKAAEMARLSVWEFADFVKQHDVEWVKYTPEEIEKECRGNAP
jgi:predicted HTH domain antitoxin